MFHLVWQLIALLVLDLIPDPEGRPELEVFCLFPLSGISELSTDSSFLSSLLVLRGPVSPSILSFFFCYCNMLLTFFPQKSLACFLKRLALYWYLREIFPSTVKLSVLVLLERERVCVCYSVCVCVCVNNLFTLYTVTFFLLVLRVSLQLIDLCWHNGGYVFVWL